MDGSKITNRYEPLVFSEIKSFIEKQNTSYDEDLINDVACLALNQLPCRYIRFNIDAAFYLDDRERSLMENSVKTAVKKAFITVVQNPRKGK